MGNWEEITRMELRFLYNLLESLESVARKSKGNDEWLAMEDDEAIGEIWKSVTGEIVKLETERCELRRMMQSAADAGRSRDIRRLIITYEQRIDFCERSLDRMMHIRR